MAIIQALYTCTHMYMHVRTNAHLQFLRKEKKSYVLGLGEKTLPATTFEKSVFQVPSGPQSEITTRKFGNSHGIFCSYGFIFGAIKPLATNSYSKNLQLLARGYWKMVAICGCVSTKQPQTVFVAIFHKQLENDFVDTLPQKATTINRSNIY